MMRRAMYWACIVFVIAALGCAPAEPTVVPQDTSAAEAAVKARSQELASKVEGPSTAWADLYTEDAIEMPMYGEVQQGRQAMIAQHEAMVQQGQIVESLRFTTREVIILGDMALETGTFNVDVKMGEQAITDTGHYMTAWKNVGGNWFVYRLIYTSSQPPPTPPAASN